MKKQTLLLRQAEKGPGIERSPEKTEFPEATSEMKED